MCVTLLWLTFVLKMKGSRWWMLIWEGNDQNHAFKTPWGLVLWGGSSQPGGGLSVKGCCVG